MSAQDDVLAAFGEPLRKTVAVEESEAAATGDGASGEQVTEDRAEAGAGDSAASETSAPAEATTGEQVPAPGLTAAAETQAPATETSEASAPAETTVGEQAAKAGQASAAAQAATDETSDAAALAEATVGEQVPAPGLTAAAETQAPATETSDPDVSANLAAPAPTTQPYLDPAAFFAQLQAETAPEPRRRRPRLVLRYGLALVVAGAVGVGTAYAVTLPRRTDVPFLATPGDGRYSFPGVVHPVPPAGDPAPGADSNQGQTHYGDLRQYLVPAPLGAVPKEGGWETVKDFEGSLSGSDVSGHLYDAGIRRVAWRGWTAGDGQHTVVELVQFPDHQGAYAVANLLDGASPAKAGGPENVVPEVTLPAFGDNTSTVAVHKFDQVNGLPGQIERRLVFQSGDVVAVVTTTAPAKVPDTPTEQVALLEAGMLR